MALNFGSLVYSVAKQKVKNKAMEHGAKAIKKIVKDHVGADITKEGYSIFLSNKSIDKAIKGVTKGYFRVKRVESTYKSIKNSPTRLYKNIKAWKKDFKVKKYQPKEIKLKKIDKRIFELSQYSLERGTIKKEDILKDKEFQDLFSKLNYKTIKEKNKGFEFGKYDVNVVFKEFDEKDLTLKKEDLTANLNKRYGKENKEKIKKQYEILMSRIEKNVVEKNVIYDDLKKEYKITEKGLKEAEKINKTFEFTKFDSEVIFKYIEKNNGSITPFELEKALNEEYKDLRYISKQQDYLVKRMDKNVEAGYLKKVDDNYKITQKGYKKKEDINQLNKERITEYLEKKIDFFEKKGFLNKRDNGAYEVTKDFYFKVKESLEENLKAPIEKKENIKKVKTIKFSEADVRIFRMIDQEKGLTITKVKERANDQKQEIMILGRMKKLEDNKFIEKIDGKYQKTELGKEEIKKFFKDRQIEKETKIKEEFKFTKFDKSILNKSKNDFLDLEKEEQLIKNRFKGNEKEIKRQIKMLKGRCEKLEVMGYLEKKDKGYKLTTKSVEIRIADKLKNLKKDEKDFIELLKKHSNENPVLSSKKIITDEEFKKLYNESFEKNMKEFQFTKYDSKLFNMFKDDKLDTLDLEIKLSSEFKKEEELLKEINIVKGRLNKNIKEGNLKYENNVYAITEKGKEEYFKAKNDLKLLDYDTDNLFKYIEKNNNKLSFYNLKKEIKEVTKTDEEYKKKFHYAKIRLNKNVEMGLLKREGNTFSITPKGVNAVKEKIENKINLENEKIDKFFHRNMKQIEGIGAIEKHNKDYKFIDGFNEILNQENIKSKEKFDFGLKDIELIDEYFINHQVKINSLENDIKKEFFGEKANKEFEKTIARLEKSIEDKYLSFDKKSKTYHITTKGLEKIKNTMKDEVKKLDIEKLKEKIKNYKLDEKTLKNHILKRHKGDKFKNKTKFIEIFKIDEEIDRVLKEGNYNINLNLKENSKGLIIEKQFNKPIGTDIKGNSISNLRIILDENFNVKTAFPTKNQLLEKYDLKLDKYKLTKFDFDNIVNSSINNIWSEKTFRGKNNKLDENKINKKIKSIKKRIETLEEMNLIKKSDEKGKYILSKKLIERQKSYEKDKTDFLSTEQQKVLSDLKTFLNFTEKQVSNLIYENDDFLSKVEMDHLLRKGYIGEKSLVLDGEEKKKIFYLTPRGKKKINNIDFVEKRKIYDSKIHHRPEELKHDLLVYSAFKDIESKLLNENYRITKVMTDKEIRAEHRRLKLEEKVEFSDLYIEIEDIKTKEKGFINVEIDCGYFPSTVKSKAENIENLVWYTDSQKQAQTIKKHAKTKKITVINLH